MQTFRFVVLALVLMVLSTACSGRLGPYDPVTQDPRPFDAAHPPRIAETAFVVEGATLNAIVYEAQGAGPHPTVLLLHGFPGNERNLDVAQSIRRAGWNVVFFHYRGAWGSGGFFGFANVLEDVAAVVEAISEPAFAGEHRIDPSRLALVGHSMGGFAALISGGEIDSVDCVASLAGANFGALARAIEADPAMADEFARLLESWDGPIRGPEGAELVSELVRSADRFDTTRLAGVLARKDLLLLAGELDPTTPPAQHHTPLVLALEAAGATSLRAKIVPDADHEFSGQRIALSREVADWLVRSCAVAD